MIGECLAKSNTTCHPQSNPQVTPDAASGPVAAVITGIAIDDEGFRCQRRAATAGRAPGNPFGLLR